MQFKAAFMFVAPETDKDKHHARIETPTSELRVVGVKNYAEAEEATRAMVADGVQAIELCAGFGNEGIARICKAAQGKAIVGAVKFDRHPAFDGKSGDELFQ